MTPIQSQWSVVPWTRYDTEPPDRALIATAEVDGRAVEMFEPMDPEWHRQHARHGAQIHDHDRDVTYRATVDERGDLDHLTVEVHGFIDDNALRRVPVARIRSAVLEQVAQAAREDEGVLSFLLPGGLTERPDLGEVARLLHEGKDRAWFHAQWPEPEWNKRTVDGWIYRARKKYPDGPPARGEKEKRTK